MTTAQTIYGVPRELLTDVLKIAGRACKSAWSAGVCDELRALLDANPEENVPCPQCGGSLRTWGCNCTPRWPIYKAASDKAPTERSVAELIRLDRSYRDGVMTGFQFGISGDEKGYADCIQQYNAGIQEAKACQPAPVAVVRPTHATPPPGTEPCGTHHDNDGLDEWRK